MSRERKILLLKSCLLATYQPFVFYTYIFLIHKIHHEISTARNPDKHQPVVCEQDNVLTNRGLACEAVLVMTSSQRGRDTPAFASLPSPAPPGAAILAGTSLSMTMLGLGQQRGCPPVPSTDPVSVGRSMVNDGLGGSVRKDKRTMQEHFWDTTSRLSLSTSSLPRSRGAVL